MNYFNQESERLRYRKLTKEDIPRWTEFFYGNDRLHLLGIDVTRTPEDLASDWINMQFQRYEEQGLGHLAITEKKSGQLIGLGGILPRDLEGKAEFEIAYSLLPEFWGKGYATEHARLMKQFGIQNNIAKRFISIIHKDNHPSIKVAKKNEMSVLFETTYLDMPVYVYGYTTIP